MQTVAKQAETPATTTTVVPETVTSASGGGCDLVNQYDWDVQVAHAVCMAESGGNPQAFNPSNDDGSNDAGLMQINSIHVISGLIGDQDRFNPNENLRAAYAIYKGGGWNAWSSFNSGRYIKFM